MSEGLLGRCLAAAAAVLVVFALTACGAGGGGELSDRTATRTDVTLPTSLPERSERPEATEAPATDEAPASRPGAPTEIAPPGTSGDGPEVTRPPETVTVAPPAERDTVTVVETARETTEAPATAVSQPATAAEEAAADDSPWLWIALAVGLVGLAVIAFVVWRRRSAAEQTWAMRMDAVARRTLATLDEVMTAGAVVTGRVEALAADARMLETQAPDEPARNSAGMLRAGLDELARALESDRRLRLGSPPPSDEQLAYSSALIREQVGQLRARLVPPEPDWERPQ